MEHLKGYEVHGKMHLVCKLKKSLYGLKQSFRSGIKNLMLTLCPKVIIGAMNTCFYI